MRGRYPLISPSSSSPFTTSRRSPSSSKSVADPIVMVRIRLVLPPGFRCRRVQATGVGAPRSERMVTIASPVFALPLMKLTTPSGNPASRTISINFAAIAGESDDGFKTTVFPATTAAIVIPDMIAKGKFQGGMIAPTPKGIYSNWLSSPG